MRIHTNKFRADKVRDALEAEIKAGRIGATVRFKVLHECGSRSHEFAHEVQLESWEKAPGDGRRLGNSGGYGAGDLYAATYDEWGWLLAALFKLDPDMVVGSVRNPVYADIDEFDEKTGASFNPSVLIANIEDGGDPYPIVVGSRNGIAGRKGAGRVQEGSMPSYWPHKVSPRTVEDVRKFAKIETEVSA